MQRIALISEHASPLGMIGGVDAGGQNIYVANVAKQLAERGLDVDVYTRCDDPRQRRPNLAAAQKRLGWRATTTFANGLAHTARYFIQRQITYHTPGDLVRSTRLASHLLAQVHTRNRPAPAT
ncbi:hypothetical protein FCJ61_26915 [Burkholderia metallica]|nr:hypothetical protein [Burkholderia metallica]